MSSGSHFRTRYVQVMFGDKKVTQFTHEIYSVSMLRIDHSSKTSEYTTDHRSKVMKICVFGWLTDN